jgi:hypothetical protein
MRRLKLAAQLAALCRQFLARAGPRRIETGRSCVARSGSVRAGQKGRGLAPYKKKEKIFSMCCDDLKTGARQVPQIDGCRSIFEILAHFYSGKLAKFVAAITHLFFRVLLTHCSVFLPHRDRQLLTMDKFNARQLRKYSSNTESAAPSKDSCCSRWSMCHTSSRRMLPLDMRRLPALRTSPHMGAYFCSFRRRSIGLQ